MGTNQKIFLLLLTIAVTCMACNPAKRVARQQRNFDKIGKLWQAQHPCAVDSVSTHTDTVTKTKVKIDTVFNDLPDIIRIDTTININKLTGVKTITVTRTVDNYFYITQKYTVVDRSQVNALHDELLRQQAITGQKNYTIYSLAAALLIIMIILIYLLYKKFKP